VQKGFLILAREQYEEVLRMSPSNSYYYNDLGRVETSLGVFDPRAFEDAEKTYRRTCELDPVNPLFRMNWSDTLKKVGKKEEAEVQEQKAYSLDPLFTARYQAQRALDLYQQKDVKAALGLLEAVVQKAPQSPEAWYCLGILELSEGKKAGALKAFQKAKGLGADPSQDPNFRNLDALMEQASH
jgi:tetratricopeptide (TPR) repeat protein